MPLKDPEARKAYHREYMKNYLKDSSKKKDHLERVARNNERLRQEISEWVGGLKSQPCTDCGGTFDPVCMDFDHLPGTKKIANVSGMHRLGFSKKKIQEEIDKCELVCANCHRIRTRDRRLGDKSL